jgi:hypothetical protein
VGSTAVFNARIPPLSGNNGPTVVIPTKDYLRLPPEHPGNYPELISISRV